jgi:hypothetical protein
MRLSLPLRPLAGLLAALALASCGGGGGAASSSTSGSSGSSPATPGITLSALATITSPTGAPAITHMADAVVVGDHAILRSDSAEVSQNAHPRTRFTIVDAQGKASASVDFGYTLAAGYNGEWTMQAIPGSSGFALLQLSSANKLFLFDDQARLTGPAAGIDLNTIANDGSTIFSTGAVVDGNGIWVAPVFQYPQKDGSAIYRIRLTKFDFSGKALTPTAFIASSTKGMVPKLAASAGALSIFWTDGTQPSLAYWAQGGGGPLPKGINAGLSQVGLLPVALNGSGKLGLLWGGKSSLSGPLDGVQLDANGDPVLITGATDWSGEILSSKWVGARRGLKPGADYLSDRLLITDLVDDTAFNGDTILVADYVYGSAPLSSVTPVTATVRRAAGARNVDIGSVLRQLVFSDHTLLLIGDSDHAEASVVTRH